MLRDTLGPFRGVQILQVSSFSNVLINRFHCNASFSYSLCSSGVGLDSWFSEVVTIA